MKLPRLESPQRYRGLYIFDFGEWTAVGYTAEEIATLLESEQYRNGKVYRIVRVSPAGEFELRGVNAERFQLESGMFFLRSELAAARADFEDLRRLASDSAPARAYVHLADWGPGVEGPRYVTALIYPAEHEDELARWLQEAGYAGGDRVEGGASLVSNYYSQAKSVLERQQIWSNAAIPPRSADELFRSVRLAVQR